MNDDNPYASPAPIDDEPPSEIELEHDEIINTYYMYHQQTLGLAIGLIFIGISLGFYAFAATAERYYAFEPNISTPMFSGIASLGLCLVFSVLGKCAWFRIDGAYRWTRNILAALFLFSIANFLLSSEKPSVYAGGAAGLSLVFWYQAHTVIKWAKRLSDFGIPTGRLSVMELNEILESRSRTTSPDHERRR